MSSFKDFQESQEKARRLADLPRREALSCGPDELVETSWDGHFSGVYLEPHRVEDDILEGEDVTDRRYTVAILGKEKAGRRSGGASWGRRKSSNAGILRTPIKKRSLSGFSASDRIAPSITVLQIARSCFERTGSVEAGLGC